MKSVFKVLAATAAGIVLFLILAAFLLPLVYDKEDLKKAIAREVYGQTGRELSINGDLDFSVFPWIAVEVSDLSLGNTAGFGEEPQARIGRARAGVALVPLFKKQISVDEISLEGLELRLTVNEQGQNNWDDLAANPAPGQPEATGPVLFSSKRIAGLNIGDASVEFIDMEAGTHYRMTDFSLQAGALGDGKPLPLELSSLVEDVIAGSRADVRVSTVAAIDLEAEKYAFEDLEMNIAVESAGKPGPDVQIRAPRVDIDLKAETLAIAAYSMELGGLRASGAVLAANLLGEVTFSGPIETADFSPAKLMQTLGMEVPVTADPKVLQHAAFQANLSGGASSLEVSDLAMELDQSLLSGSLEVLNFDQPKVRFRILLDEIDIDRYLEPSADADAAAQDEVALPQEELRGPDIQGQLRAGALRMAGLAFSDAAVDITLSNGKLRLHPLTAEFYGGRYNGDVSLNGSGAVPLVSLDEEIDAISFQLLLADLAGSEALSGTARGNVKLTGRGANSGEVLSSLQGELGLALTEGAVEGINIWYEIRRGLALYKGLPMPDPEPKRTVFSRMSLDGTVDNGIVTTRELVGELPFLSLRGTGKIDLGQSALNLNLVARVRKSPDLENDPLGAGLGGKSLPFKLTGALDAPSLSVDWQSLLKSEAANVLLDKLGLGQKDEKAEPGTEEPGEPGTEDGAAEEESSRDQLKETARGALFELLKGKDEDKDPEEENDGN